MANTVEALICVLKFMVPGQIACRLNLRSLRYLYHYFTKCMPLAPVDQQCTIILNGFLHRVYIVITNCLVGWLAAQHHATK